MRGPIFIASTPAEQGDDKSFILDLGPIRSSLGYGWFEQNWRVWPR